MTTILAKEEHLLSTSNLLITIQSLIKRNSQQGLLQPSLSQFLKQCLNLTQLLIWRLNSFISNNSSSSFRISLSSKMAKLWTITSITCLTEPLSHLHKYQQIKISKDSFRTPLDRTLTSATISSLTMKTTTSLRILLRSRLCCPYQEKTLRLLSS